MHPFFIQAFYYGLLMVATILIVGAVQRGFFFKYLKVRLSFGKYILVKRRTVLRDFFSVGWVEENILVFKEKKVFKRLDLKPGQIYKCLAVNWVDLDDDKNAISKTDYSAVSGFDAEKFSNLLTRCLMRPSIRTNKDIIIVVLVCLALICSIGAFYFSFKNLGLTQQLYNNLPSMVAGIKGQVTGGTSVI